MHVEIHVRTGNHQHDLLDLGLGDTVVESGSDVGTKLIELTERGGDKHISRSSSHSNYTHAIAMSLLSFHSRPGLPQIASKPVVVTMSCTGWTNGGIEARYLSAFSLHIAFWSLRSVSARLSRRRVIQARDVHSWYRRLEVQPVHSQYLGPTWMLCDERSGMSCRKSAHSRWLRRSLCMKSEERPPPCNEPPPHSYTSTSTRRPPRTTTYHWDCI
jgi:hypothetical protein